LGFHKKFSAACLHQKKIKSSIVQNLQILEV
jgi:hypothetical protein